MLENFLEKLFNSTNRLSLLLLEAKQLAEDFDDIETVNYIEKEISGYKIENGLPDYRKIKGQIVADIRNVYGELEYREYPIDFSLLSEKIGLDLDDAYIPEGMSFIETSLNNLSGPNALRPIPKQICKMLDDTFHSTNKDFHLITAYHKIPTPTLEYIPIRVRQNLIQQFQNLIKRHKKNKDNAIILKDNLESITKQKKVFISYAWEDDIHNSKVISFVEFLRKNGFDASMDRKNTQEEASMNFNKLMIDGIQNSDKVVIVLSKKYKKKADNFEGGVWQELNMIIENMKENKNKYIFTYFGYDDRKDITPNAIVGSDILDLKKDQDDNNFNTLFAKIKEENIIEFSNVNEKEVEINKRKINPFKL